MGRFIAVLVLVLALALLGVGAFNWWQGRGAAHQLAAAEQTAGVATVAAGQADARTQAVRIVVAGESRDRATDAVHLENSNALLQAPGADAPIDPVLVQRARDGLCRYSAYRDDLGCAGLREPDPAELPQAGPGRPPDP